MVEHNTVGPIALAMPELVMALPTKATGFTLTLTIIFVLALIHQSVSDGQIHVCFLIIVLWEPQISKEQSFNSTKFSGELKLKRVITLDNGWLESIRQIGSNWYVYFSEMVKETTNPVMLGRWTMQVKVHLFLRHHLHLFLQAPSLHQNHLLVHLSNLPANRHYARAHHLQWLRQLSLLCAQVPPQHLHLLVHLHQSQDYFLRMNLLCFHHRCHLIFQACNLLLTYRR